MKKADDKRARQIRDKRMALVKFENEADKEAIQEVKNYFGFKTNGSAVMFLIRRTADNIRSGKPLSILSR